MYLQQCQLSPPFLADGQVTTTHSIFETICSGLALKTTKIKIGKNASADVCSDPASWRMSPDRRNASSVPGVSSQIEGSRTEYNFAAIQDADHLIPRCLVVIDLQQFFGSRVNITTSIRGKATRPYPAPQMPRSPGWLHPPVHPGASPEPSQRG